MDETAWLSSLRNKQHDDLRFDLLRAWNLMSDARQDFLFSHNGVMVSLLAPILIDLAAAHDFRLLQEDEERTHDSEVTFSLL
jgi:hypothetical protein